MNRILFTLTSIFFSCLFWVMPADASLASQYHIQSSAKVSMKSLASHLQTVELQTPRLGTSLTEARTQGSVMGLGVLNQSLTTSERFLWGATIMGVGASVAVFAGNIYALNTKRFQFPWGIAGVSVGGLAAVTILFLTIDETVFGRAMGMVFLAAPVALIGMGIVNIIQSRRRRFRRYRRRRYRRHRRRRFRPYRSIHVVPWMNVEQNRGPSGGLAAFGTF